MATWTANKPKATCGPVATGTRFIASIHGYNGAGDVADLTKV